MHVLYFHQHFSTPRGATGTRSYEMAQRLIRRGHTVTMVCGSYDAAQTGLDGPFVNGRRRGTADGIDVIELELPYANVHGFGRRSRTFLRFALRSVGLALREPADLVFATTTPLTAGIPGITARWIRRKPFVFEVRDLWPELPRAMGVISNPVILGLMRVLEWVSYRSATRCIGLAPGIVDGIAARGVSREKIALVPNGCDLDLFRPSRDRTDLGRLLPSLTDTDTVAVFTGAHGIANGLDAVLNAAAEIKRRGRADIRFVFIGRGKMKRQLMERATTEELPVDFLDAVPKTELAGLLAGTDVGLMILADVPEFYQGTSPNKFFDYIAAGLPVLNNYPGWLAELISEHRCGIAVPPRDPRSFADALEALADDLEGRRLMGKRARELAEREFDRDLLGERFVGVLEDAAQ